MPDYSKCVIYTIRTGEGLYVGSTCNFVNRKRSHKSNINNEARRGYNNKLYTTIRDNDGAWDMQPHSQFPCNSKTEMNIQEEKVRIELKADLNMYSCYGFDKKEYNKTYKLANNDKHREYMTRYNKEYYLKKKNELI